MKRFFACLIGILVCLKSFSQMGYFYGDNFIQLSPTKEKRFFVQARNSETKKILQNEAAETSRPGKDAMEVYQISENRFFVSSTTNLKDDDYISEEYVDTKGTPYYILPQIVLAIKDGAFIDDIIKSYSEYLTLDARQRLKGMVILNCCYTSARDILNTTLELKNNKSVEWAEPNMLCKWSFHDLNPLFSLQYYLQNGNNNEFDINVVPAWGITTGNGNITVAVIDQGIDPDHEDLIGNVLQGYTVGDSLGYGAPKNDNEFDYKAHGVACAGIIAAKNNDKGILGVAHGVKLLPVNIVPYTPIGYYEGGVKKVTYNGFSDDIEIADAIQWAAERADVLSCSWGGSIESNVITSVINDALSNGRNGKGCVIVAASGNSYPVETAISYPARLNDVIAVGAIDRYGYIQPYSQRGSDLDLVAPSGNVVTTDRMGSLGYNPANSYGTDLAETNYTQKFGGTSAACPQVAGIAALMLSVNPNLTVSQIRFLLRNSATDLGINGFDTTFGCGLVNAHSAVFLSTSPVISGPTVPGSPSTYYIENLPYGLIVTWSLEGKTSLPSYFTSNYPIINQLQIDNSSKQHIKETLVAKIYMPNGTLAKTLTKSIDTAEGFSGTYLQTVPTPYQVISGTFYDGSLIQVKQGLVVYLTSSDFNGATVSCTSSNPPTISTSGNTISVYFLNSTSFSSATLHCVKGDKVIEFKLRAEPTLQIDPILHLMANINGGKSYINISLSENVDSGQPMRGNTFDSWELTIYSYTTGKVVHRQKVSGRSVSIDTSAWEPDTYIVRIWIDDKEIVQKISIE